MHDPESQAEVAAARRLGGLRRRREKTTAKVFGWQGVDSIEQLQLLLTIGIHDVLGLENSLGRGRVIAQLVTVGMKLLETAQLEERLAALQAAVFGKVDK